MTNPFKPLLDRDFLASELYFEYESFKDTREEEQLRERLEAWDRRTTRGETAIQAAFIQTFFQDIWGYMPDGRGAEHFTLREQFPVPGAGSGGASGTADLALGRFGADGTGVPQVLCEFKGIGSDLDKPQPRKANTRSPSRQALDYLTHARRGYFDSAAVLPRFALVTDMNQFRLYWYDQAPDRYLAFRLSGATLFDAASLLSNTEKDRFDRFLFWRLLQPDMLLSEYGRTRFERLVERQGSVQKKLENDFYQEYREYRLRLYNELKLQNLSGISDREKLRLSQKLLDRIVFLMFAEDMGARIAFPPRLLSDYLKQASLDAFYEPEDTNIWERLLRVFDRMNAGGKIGEGEIHKFNGGLFSPDPLLDGLRLPNRLFCIRGQGRNDATIASEKATLLYLAATYNYASEGDARNSIGLYTLGHIFEQSLVDLEVLEAEAENRLSLSIITKRKRDGVYYTPEPIVRRILEETLTPLLNRWKSEAGWTDDGPLSRAAADIYWNRLRNIKVVDPACGSGAFLIGAFRSLFSEFRATLDKRLDLRLDSSRVDDAAIARMILENNIYGVDINPLSVEIAQLSLWLHSARPRETLSSFERVIRCGNSLVDPQTLEQHGVFLETAQKERVAPFDWHASFPEVFSGGGFDIVVGNPPYVKLQNFRRVYSETAEYLRGSVSGHPIYRSTQTGNYDLYLPFIERGLSLLNAGGRMGYIAPNLWPSLEHGRGIRKLVSERQSLERWIDFRSHQVFEEATIYTAIQVFTATPNKEIAVAFAWDGDLSKVDMNAPAARVPYAELDTTGGEWLLAPGPVRSMVRRLGHGCQRLDSPEVTSAIFQGLITSADNIYHLRKLGRGRYLHTPPPIRGVRPASVEVSIEDEIMKPLVSGPEAKRFISPATETYVLFPYSVTGDASRLWSQQEMERRFPKAWEYLRKHESELRARENFAFDDLNWYRFGRKQNVDKQEHSKLFVAQLVPSMRVCFDELGEFYANNVRVNCIIPEVDGWFLTGVLNCRTIDAVFRWIGKPKDNGYYEANRQFIAPLPIPSAGEADRARLALIAQQLQASYTRRAQLSDALRERIARIGLRRKPFEWLLPEVRSKAAIEATAPAKMQRADRRPWADRLYEEEVEAAIARVDSLIRSDSDFNAIYDDGELRFLVDGAPVANGIYVSPVAGALLTAQWEVIALNFEPKGRDDGKRLVETLRNVGEEAPDELQKQIIERQSAFSTLAREISRLEQELHELTCRLFSLTPEERRLVEAL